MKKTEGKQGEKWLLKMYKQYPQISEYCTMQHIELAMKNRAIREERTPGS